jgi:hypothetical protein
VAGAASCFWSVLRLRSSVGRPFTYTHGRIMASGDSDGNSEGLFEGSF